jgi:hypothetical protein
VLPIYRLNLLSFVSSNISIQRFVLHNALSISTKASDVTEITSRSIIDCANECKRNKLCHIASYDKLAKRCRIFNEQTSRNCDVGLDVIQISVFLKKVDGKLCIFDRFPFVLNYILGVTDNQYGSSSRQTMQLVFAVLLCTRSTNASEQKMLARNQENRSEWGFAYTNELLFLIHTNCCF